MSFSAKQHLRDENFRIQQPSIKILSIYEVRARETETDFTVTRRRRRRTFRKLGIQI